MEGKKVLDWDVNIASEEDRIYKKIKSIELNLKN